MKKLTAIIPVGSESHNIREVESVYFADEIMVVDSYSTDRTIDTKEYTDFIIQRE